MTAETEDHEGRRRFRIGLAVIAAVALILRVVYAQSARNLLLQSDGTHYPVAAKALLRGEGFINPLAKAMGGGVVEDATHPPFWTVVLAGATKLGVTTNFGYQLVAAVIGVGTVVMVGFAAREAFDRRVGLIAAALAAVYPGLFLYERELVSETLALFGVATLLFLTYRFHHRPGPWRAVALGLALGLCALTRSELIAASLLIVTPVILLSRGVSMGRRVAWLGMAAAMTVAVLSPWFLYNTTRFDRPVPLSVGLGATMAAGNCPATYEGERTGYYHIGCVFLQKNLSSDPSISDGQYRAVALDFMKSRPADAIRVAGIRVARTFGVYAPFQQREFEAERGTPMWVLSTALWSYWLLVPAAVWGAVIARRRRVPIYPLLAFLVSAVAAVMLTIGAFRYRASFEVALVILAAAGIDAVVRAITRRRREPDPIGDDLVGPVPQAGVEVAPVP